MPTGTKPCPEPALPTGARSRSTASERASASSGSDLVARDEVAVFVLEAGRRQRPAVALEQGHAAARLLRKRVHPNRSVNKEETKIPPRRLKSTVVHAMFWRPLPRWEYTHPQVPCSMSSSSPIRPSIIDRPICQNA